jgi:hypothetical protein
MEFSSSADAGGEIVRLMLGRHRLRGEQKTYMYRIQKGKEEGKLKLTKRKRM